MEATSTTTTRLQLESKNPSPVSSPHGNGTNISSNGMVQIHGVAPPIIPISNTRSDTTNPYPTTFVQADSSNFKQVVQLLTGSAETAKQASSPRPTPTNPTQLDQQQQQQQTRNFPIPPMKTTPKKQQQSSNGPFKLYERRFNNSNNHSIKATLMINTLLPGFNNQVSGFSPRNNGNKPAEILSPSMLDFPRLTLSPVTPLNEDPFNKTSPYSLGNSSSSEEERAIAEKGFYLHPSPMSTPRDSEPQLLPLFPVTSPRISESSST